MTRKIKSGMEMQLIKTSLISGMGSATTTTSGKFLVCNTGMGHDNIIDTSPQFCAVRGGPWMYLHLLLSFSSSSSLLSVD